MGVGGGGGGRKDLKLSGPLLSSFWLPGNLTNYKDRQAHTGDRVLVRCRGMTGRSQTLSWWLEGGGVKTTEKNVLANAVGIGHVCIMRKYVIRLLITQSKPAPLSKILSYTHLPSHCLRFFS
jgi:hypothetical protein